MIRIELFKKIEDDINTQAGKLILEARREGWDAAMDSIGDALRGSNASFNYSPESCCFVCCFRRDGMGAPRAYQALKALAEEKNASVSGPHPSDGSTSTKSVHG